MGGQNYHTTGTSLVRVINDISEVVIVDLESVHIH